ncbi:phosphohistidine phosphatase [Aliiruegeria haliotis]|uniref:Phosphohistidine phosphatase n=1 Tax=Aliiruegeria haliotis TaxID=1280846 RepID=A0A2T0RIJ5_9RHOB|nr:NUDIX domain-containing protein [Aliiruegeria haliotis]PRY20942.1 phosphohistidine phosphatase [Aliiruegeria haliotis]
MPRDLLLLRHGKAVSGHAGPDLARPLKDRGKRQAQRIGVWLAGNGLLPTVVISSPAERAFVTAQKTLKAAGVGAGGIVLDDRLGPDRADAHLALLGERFGASSAPLMLVGHRAGLEGLVRHLTGDRRSRLDLKSGTLVHLLLSDGAEGLGMAAAQDLRFVRQQDLPKRFPFPGPGGTEWRDRPAYYYRQSAVVPYRFADGRLQILVITSSKRNHWVVPKGIHEPGASAQASAAREAEEEAGIFGEVEETPLGRFDVAKWGATCMVTTYAMRVTRILDDDAWDENHRHRLWVTPEQALARLKHAGLKRLVADFAARMGEAGGKLT